MTALSVEIRESCAAMERLLEELGLGTYVYSLESKNGRWQVRLECNVVFQLPTPNREAGHGRGVMAAVPSRR